jgi:genome maintenance exonuclease 1
MTFTHTNIPQFNELDAKIVNGKRYYTTPIGKKYPSITTILSAKPKPYLEEWRQSLGVAKADKETKRCADRGTVVHLLAEKYLNNEENFTKGEAVENIRLFNQIKLRLNNIDNIRIQEAPLYSDELEIAGRVDIVAEYENVLSIIDFKTSNNNKTEDMIEDYKLQCCLYSLCWYEMFGEFIEDFVIIIAVEKGMMPQVFRGKVKDYVIEAKQRIDEFYVKHGN